MRITNKIMQSNSLANINRNKILQDKLNTQMTTQKKLTKASDDPVVAIRALRLRTNLSEITQYYEKNVPDARSWLEVTEDALLEASDVITELYTQCNKGASGYLDVNSRKAILEQMESLRDHIYASADADYAGRSLFTGYRTASKATFQKATSENYGITEQFNRDSLDSFTYVNTQDLMDINSDNYAAKNATEQNVVSKEIHRIRLAYDNLDAAAPEPPTLTDAKGDPIKITDSSGVTKSLTVEVVSSEGTTPVDPGDLTKGYKNPYTDLGDNDVFFVPETGELLLGKNAYEKLAGMVDNPATDNINEGEFRVKYGKTDWDKGDLNPINYYACTKVDADGKTINYNAEYLTDGKSVQSIEYDVGFNQSMRVNTTADEVFDPGIGRDVDELVKALQDVADIDEVVKTLEAVVAKDETDAKAQEKLLAAKKAQSELTDKLGKMFEHAQTKMQDYQNKVNVAVANSGTRSARLDMVENRLSTQQTTFDTLASENENIDMTQVAIELGSAELIYEAALRATGMVAQTSLLNYI